MRFFMGGIFSVFFLLFYGIATIIFSSAIVIGGLFTLLIPFKSWRYQAVKFLLKIPVWWAGVANSLLMLSPKHQFNIRCDTSANKNQLSPEKWYVLIANHQTWLDILMLGYAFNRKIPVLKFFMKQQLLWSLPIAGLACWVLDYPFMRRHTRQEILRRPELRNQDIETTKRACQKFKLYPTTVMNFIEGTRFTKAKQQRQHSPFNHLLKPKSGGIAIVMNELRDCLHGIVNVTIHYSNPDITFLKFFFGPPCRVTIHYELLPVTADIIGDYYTNREFRVHFQRWLNLLWERKDLLLDDSRRAQI